MRRDEKNWYRERAYATGRAITAHNRVEMSEVTRESSIANNISSEVSASIRARGSGQRTSPANTRQKKSINAADRMMREPLNQEHAKNLDFRFMLTMQEN